MRRVLRRTATTLTAGPSRATRRTTGRTNSVSRSKAKMGGTLFPLVNAESRVQTRHLWNLRPWMTTAMDACRETQTVNSDISHSATEIRIGTLLGGFAYISFISIFMHGDWRQKESILSQTRNSNSILFDIICYSQQNCTSSYN